MPNDVARLFDAELPRAAPAPTPVSPVQNDVSRLFDEANGRQPVPDERLTLSLRGAQQLTPDQWARGIEASRKAGLPIGIGSRNPEEAAKMVTRREFEEAVRMAPAIGAAALRDPNLARLMQDDLRNVVDIELKSREFNGVSPVRGPKASFFSVLSGLGTMAINAPAEWASASKEVLAGALGDTRAAGNYARDSATARARVANARPELSGMSELDRMLLGGAYGGAESAIMNAPGLAAGAIAASTGAGAPAVVAASLAPMFAQVLPTAFSRASAQGLSFSDSLQYGLGQAAVETLTEIPAIGFLAKRMGKEALSKLIGGYLFRDIGSEQVATLAGDALDTAFLPGQSWDQYFSIKGRGEAAIQTLLATVVGGGALAGVVKLAEGLVGPAPEAERAIEASKVLQNMSKFVAASKVRNRDATTMETLLQSLQEENGAPTTLYLDSNVLTPEMQQQLEALMPSVAAQRDEIVAGAMIELPVGELLTKLAGTPLEQQLVPELRTDENALSVREAETFYQSQSQAFEAAAEKLAAQKTQDTAWNASAQELNDTLTGMFTAVPTINKDQARAYVAPLQAFYTTLADRLGIAPAEAYNRYKVTLSSEQIANATLTQDNYSDLKGLPATVDVDGKQVTFGAIPLARNAAAQYMRSAGLPYAPPRDYAKVDPDRARRIAEAFDMAEHRPNDPEVAAAYAAMIAETLAQYQAIKATGLKVEFITDGKDPYGNPRNAIIDVRENNHLWVFSTMDGFGSSDFDAASSPMLQPTNEVDVNGKPMLVNDVFRVVHDYFGHIKDGIGFRADGEENAWRSHAAMYSPLARRAMTTETRGQNSWVNFGPFAEKNKTAGPADTVYADQKVTLLPEWVSTEGAGAGPVLTQSILEQRRGALPLLSEAELAVSAIGLMSESGTKLESFAEREVGALPEMVRFLMERRAATGEPTYDITNPEDQQKIARIMVAEAIEHAAREGDALAWYDETIDKTVARLALKYPEVDTDPNARAMLLLATAITSQGLNPEDNLALAVDIYSEYRTNGRFPLRGSGPSLSVMAGNFAKANDILDKLEATNGGDKAAAVTELRTFLSTPYRAGDLKKAGFSIDEKVDEMVLGSVIFGSKIGFGFYSNLNGNFEPVTIDMWFMRTIGRIAGTLAAFDEGLYAEQVQRFRDALRERGAKGRGLFAAQIEAMLKDKVQGPVNLLTLARTDDQAVIDLARFVASAHERDYKANRAAFDAKTRVKTELVAAAGNMIISLDKPKDVPASGGEKQNLRAIVRMAVEGMQQAYGTRVPPAALQALIWYPEQYLYKQSGVKLRVVGQDYAGAAAKLLSEEGFSDADISAADSRRLDRGQAGGPQAGEPGGVLPGAGQPDRADAPVRDSRAALARVTGTASGNAGGTLNQGSARPVPEYGVARDGATSVFAIHYSPRPQTQLESSKYGTGMRGAEAARIDRSFDDRLRQRIHFYVDGGNGISPENAVGGNMHWVRLNNVYDINEDALGIWSSGGDLNAREGKIIDAGFDGYVADMGKQRAAVLLGKHSVPVESGALQQTATEVAVDGIPFAINTPLAAAFPRPLPDNDPRLTVTSRINTPEREALRARIVDSFFEGKTPSASPTTTVMAGGGGAGKGTIKRALIETGVLEPSNAIDVDPDEIKAMLPEYDALIALGDSRAAATVHEESSMLAERVMARALEGGFDLVVDKTMSKSKTGNEIIDQSQSLGRAVRMFGVTIDPRVAVVRALRRAEATGRFVPIGTLLSAHKGFAGAVGGYLEKVDEAILFDNSTGTPRVIARKDADGLFVDDKMVYDSVVGLAEEINSEAQFVGRILPEGLAGIGEVRGRVQEGFGREAQAAEGRLGQDREGVVSGERVSRRSLSFKEVVARTPELQEGAKKLAAGEITSAEYDALVARYKPVEAYDTVPVPATDGEMRSALTSDKVERLGAPDALEEGHPVGMRLDIPAYSQHGVWVVSVHEQQAGFSAGTSIGYTSAAKITGASFGVVEKAALNIAGGKPKATIAVIKGNWSPTTPEEAKAQADAALADPAWRQVGMDPERHAYFYDRVTMDPIVSADEVIQVGPLVLARNPKYGKKSDYLFQEPTEIVRGQIQFAPDIAMAASRITLLPDADMSTFLHEMGHFMLEVYTDIASKPNPPPEIVKDLEALLKWMGFKGTDDQTPLQLWTSAPISVRREYHETFARGFEAYLREGNAPTVDLQPFFSKFRSWLVRIYKTLTQLNVKLSPEVRQVMDRMLASEQQIDESRQIRSQVPLFASAEELGMDEKQWADYQALNDAQREEAISDLQARSIRNMQWLGNARSREMRKLQKKAAEIRKEMMPAVLDEIRKRPVYAARRFLSRGVLPEGDQVTGAKLSIAALKEMYGDAANAPWRYLSTGKFGLATSNEAGALHPDVVAGMFGFTSGDHLVRELLAARPESEEATDIIDRRMLEEYSDLSDEASMNRAIDSALANEARSKFLATELAALTKTQAPIRAMAKAAKEWAAKLVGAKKIRDIKPGTYSAAEAKEGRHAMNELKLGNTARAAIHKRNQLLQHHAARTAADALEEVEKAVAYLKKFNSPGVREKIDQAYLDQIDKILEKFDLRNMSLAAMDKRAALSRFVAALPEGLELDLPDYVQDDAQRVPYRELTLEDFRGVVDSVKMIDHLGRLKEKLLTAKEAREFQAVVDEISTSIDTNGTKTVKLRVQRTAGRSLGKMVRGFIAGHRKMSSLFKEMDGSVENGPLWRYIIKPMNDRSDMEATMRAEASAKLQELFAGIRDGGKFGGSGVFLPGLNLSLNREERISVALNVGNEGNLQRLLNGQDNGRGSIVPWTPLQVQEVLDTLTEAEWKFVQGVWDFFEDTYKPQVAAKQKRVTGVEPEWVVPTPVTTPFGVLRGGYFPIVYDTNQSIVAGDQKDVELAKQQMQGAARFATTRRGHTKERAEQVTGRPLLLSLDAIGRNVNDVIHDLTWHEWLIDTNRLLKSPAIADAILHRYGPEVLSNIKSTVLDIATGDNVRQTVLDPVLNHLRAGSTIVGMGWSLSTALINVTGFASSAVRIGPEWVLKGLYEMMGSPSHIVETRALVHEKSEFMANRARTLNREINDVMNTIVGDRSDAQEKFRASFFWMITKTQEMVDIPTWLGAYNKATAQFPDDDAKAVALADQAVRDAQGAGQTADLAPIQRGSASMRLFTTFYSYMNTQYNLAVDVTKARTRRGEYGMLAVDYLVLMAVPAMLTVVLKTLFGLMAGDDWDEEKFAKKLAAEFIAYPMSMLVGFRELAAAGQFAAGVNDFGGGYPGPAGLRAFAEMTKLGQQIGQGEPDMALLKAAVNTGGILLHFPGGQVSRTVEGAVAMAEGEASPLALLFGPPRD